MTTDLNVCYTTGLVPAGVWMRSDPARTTIPIGPNVATILELFRVAVPVQAGDCLVISADGQLSNNVASPGYTVGCCWNLWMYDADDTGGGHGIYDTPWLRVGSSLDDNVSHDRHHMPFGLHRVFQVPSWWIAGNRMMVALQMACGSDSTHRLSTDEMTVDPLGEISVTKWSVPA